MKTILVFSKEYAKRNLQEKALTEISDIMNISVAEILQKMNGLRGQFGRELVAVKKVKS